MDINNKQKEDNVVNIINDIIDTFYKTNGVKHYCVDGKDICVKTQRRYDLKTKNCHPITKELVKKIINPVKINIKSDRNNDRLNRFLESEI